MESSINWSKLIESTEDPFSLEVAEKLIECVLSHETSRKISFPEDVEPLDDKNLDFFEVVKKSRISLIRHILDKVKNSVNKSDDSFNKNFFDITNEEIITLISFSDKEIEEIFIDEKNVKCSDNFKKVINLINEMTDIRKEHIGKRSIFKTKNPERKSVTRIYLNTPVNKNGVAFLTEFIKKSIDRGIKHDMKGFDKYDDSLGEKDRSVLYGHSECFLDQIEILEEISQEHPEWINDFGTPIYTGGRPKINSNKEWYSVAYTPTDPRTGSTLMTTYNDFIDHSARIAFGSIMCQYMGEKNRESLRTKYNHINKTNIDSKSWENIINQMALLSSEKSAIWVGKNNFELESGKVSIREIEFSYFLLYEADGELKEKFNKFFVKGSEEREVFIKKFRTQTEKVVTRALGKENSPIYMNPKIASEYSKREEKHYKKDNGFRALTDEDLGELPKANGFRVPTDEDLGELPKPNGFRAPTDEDLRKSPKSNRFRITTDFDR